MFPTSAGQAKLEICGRSVSATPSKSLMQSLLTLYGMVILMLGVRDSQSSDALGESRCATCRLQARAKPRSAGQRVQPLATVPEYSLRGQPLPHRGFRRMTQRMAASQHRITHYGSTTLPMRDRGAGCETRLVSKAAAAILLLAAAIQPSANSMDSMTDPGQRLVNHTYGGRRQSGSKDVFVESFFDEDTSTNLNTKPNRHSHWFGVMRPRTASKYVDVPGRNPTAHICARTWFLPKAKTPLASIILVHLMVTNLVHLGKTVIYEIKLRHYAFSRTRLSTTAMGPGKAKHNSRTLSTYLNSYVDRALFRMASIGFIHAAHYVILVRRASTARRGQPVRIALPLPAYPCASSNTASSEPRICFKLFARVWRLSNVVPTGKPKESPQATCGHHVVTNRTSGLFLGLFIYDLRPAATISLDISGNWKTEPGQGTGISTRSAVHAVECSRYSSVHPEWPC
uniref:Ferric oxidoreductase domain-containing protein n=1 Tax=Macrostomum lignano TaxID=282301 RepID=A0A1I8FPK4_9PLAT